MEHTPLDRLMTALDLQVGTASLVDSNIATISIDRELAMQAVREHRKLKSNINQLRIMLHITALNPDSTNLLDSIHLLENMFGIEILEKE